MIYCNIDFNNKTILRISGTGFICSNLPFIFQENFPKSIVIVFDPIKVLKFLQIATKNSFGHYKNLIGFKGRIFCGNINIQADLALLADLSLT